MGLSAPCPTVATGITLRVASHIVRQNMEDLLSALVRRYSPSGDHLEEAVAAVEALCMTDTSPQRA